MPEMVTILGRVISIGLVLRSAVVLSGASFDDFVSARFWVWAGRGLSIADMALTRWTLWPRSEIMS